MEGTPTNPIESIDNNPEKITSEQLISFAKEKPSQSLEVRKMLIQWLEQTSVPESARAESVEYVDVAIMHSVMKYRLGFLTKEEVLQELEEAGGILASEYIDTSELHNKLSQLMYAIEDGAFEVIKPIG